MQGWGATSPILKRTFFVQSAFRRATGSSPSRHLNLERVCTILRPALTRLYAYQKQHEAKVVASEVFSRVLGLLEAGPPIPCEAHLLVGNATVNLFSPRELLYSSTAAAPMLLAESYYELLGVVVDLAHPDHSCMCEVSKAHTIRRIHDRIIHISPSDDRWTREAISLSHISAELAEELLTYGTMGFVRPTTQKTVFAVRWADNPAQSSA